MPYDILILNPFKDIIGKCRATDKRVYAKFES